MKYGTYSFTFKWYTAEVSCRDSSEYCYLFQIQKNTSQSELWVMVKGTTKITKIYKNIGKGGFKTESKYKKIASD